MMNRRTGVYSMGRGHTRIQIDHAMQNRIERRIKMLENSTRALKEWREKNIKPE